MRVEDVLGHMETFTSVGDLMDYWVSNWKGWLTTYSPLDLRRLIAKKDAVKIDLMRSVGTFDESIRSTIESMFCEAPSLSPAWEELAGSGWDSSQVAPLNEAMFLFAINLIDSTSPQLLDRKFSKYERSWKAFLPADAYRIIHKRFMDKSIPSNLAAYREVMYGC